MADQHFHIVSAGEFAYPGVYTDQQQAEQQAAHIRRTEDIDAAVDSYCYQGRCAWCQQAPASVRPDAVSRQGVTA